MWSQLLAELLACPWVNLSLPGLGNEAIANLVIDELNDTSNSTDLWMVQWAAPIRFDLRLTGSANKFIPIIQTDPVYYDNFITSAKNKRYWSSSVSKLKFVTDSNAVLSTPQKIDRSRLYQQAVAYQLDKRNVNWKYIFTSDSSWSMPFESMVSESMNEFAQRSQYKSYDVGEIQPVSSIHLDFLETFILPDLEFDERRLTEIRTRVINDDRIRKETNSHQVMHNQNIIR